MKKRTRRLKKEWQEAVDLANFYLLLDSCRQYGSVTGGPKINVDRCVEIIQEGKKRGISPSNVN